jgi:hypothetical protein
MKWTKFESNPKSLDLKYKSSVKEVDLFLFHVDEMDKIRIKSHVFRECTKWRAILNKNSYIFQIATDFTRHRKLQSWPTGMNGVLFAAGVRKWAIARHCASVCNFSLFVVSLANSSAAWFLREARSVSLTHAPVPWHFYFPPLLSPAAAAVQVTISLSLSLSRHLLLWVKSQVTNCAARARSLAGSGWTLASFWRGCWARRVLFRGTLAASLNAPFPCIRTRCDGGFFSRESRDAAEMRLSLGLEGRLALLCRVQGSLLRNALLYCPQIPKLSFVKDFSLNIAASQE